MSRRYTAEQKAQALEQLVANGGDVAFTSAQLGIPSRTLQHWKRQLPAQQQQQQQQQQAPFQLPVIVPPAIPADTAEQLRALRDKLTRDALLLADSLAQGIEEATISQRATALHQVLSTIVKLTALLPSGDQDDQQEFRIVYEDAATGQIAETPPWAVDDPQV